MGTPDVVAGALELFAPAPLANYRAFVAELALIERRVEHLEIRDRAQAGDANDGLVEVKRIQREAERIRRAQVDPLNEEVKAINAAWKAITDPCARIETAVKRKVSAYLQAERERVAAEQAAARAAQEEAARKQAAALAKAESARSSKAREAALAQAQQATQALMDARVAEPMDAPTGLRGDGGTTSIRHRWVFRVVDEAAVPRQYLRVDEQAIRRAVAEGARDILGLVIYEEEGLATRL